MEADIMPGWAAAPLHKRRSGTFTCPGAGVGGGEEEEGPGRPAFRAAVPRPTTPPSEGKAAELTAT